MVRCCTDINRQWWHMFPLSIFSGRAKLEEAICFIIIITRIINSNGIYILLLSIYLFSFLVFCLFYVANGFKYIVRSHTHQAKRTEKDDRVKVLKAIWSKNNTKTHILAQAPNHIIIYSLSSTKYTEKVLAGEAAAAARDRCCMPVANGLINKPSSWPRNHSFTK